MFLALGNVHGLQTSNLGALVDRRQNLRSGDQLGGPIINFQKNGTNHSE